MIKYLALSILLVVAAAVDVGEYVCEDTLEQGHCAAYVKYDPLICDREVGMMARTCAKTCKLCRPSIVINECDDWWGNGLCTHLLKHRPEYCGRGFIPDDLTENRVDFLNSQGGEVVQGLTGQFCARTCEQCTGPYIEVEGCEDLASPDDCAYLADKRGICDKDEKFMKYTCRKTCGLCEESPDNFH